MLWVFVAETGEVKAAIVERPAGLDFDLTAIAVAKKFRFKPATLGGRPISAWVLVPVTTPARVERCSAHAVPLSAGSGLFVDSAVLERPELGIVYRYRGLEGLDCDVFIYPATGWPSPEDQAAMFLEATDLERQRGDLSSYTVLDDRIHTIKSQSGSGRKTVTFEGHRVTLNLTRRMNQALQSYLAVFPHGSKYVKLRVTHDPDRRATAAIEGFLQQFLSALASQPPACRS